MFQEAKLDELYLINLLFFNVHVVTNGTYN